MCYHCDEKYSINHKYKNRQFNLIIAEEYDDDRAYMEGKNGEDSGMELAMDENGVSIHAIIGNQAKTTLKIIGTIKKRKLTILIDSGSTHSVLDYDIAKEQNCEM